MHVVWSLSLRRSWRAADIEGIGGFQQKIAKFAKRERSPLCCLCGLLFKSSCSLYGFLSVLQYSITPALHGDTVNCNEPRPHLAILTTHPIQYQVPLFRELAQDPRHRLTVLFASLQGAVSGRDPGFGRDMQWDIPMLGGYESELLKNVARNPSVSTFWGTNVPTLVARFRDLRPDVVLIPGWGRRYYLQGIRAARALGIPYLIRGEARLTPNQTRIRSLVKRCLVSPLVRGAAALLTIGEANRKFYRWCGADESRFFDSLYGVDNAFFAEARAARDGRHTQTSFAPSTA